MYILGLITVTGWVINPPIRWVENIFSFLPQAATTRSDIDCYVVNALASSPVHPQWNQKHCQPMASFEVQPMFRHKLIIFWVFGMHSISSSTKAWHAAMAPLHVAKNETPWPSMSWPTTEKLQGEDQQIGGSIELKWHLNVNNADRPVPLICCSDVWPGIVRDFKLSMSTLAVAGGFEDQYWPFEGLDQAWGGKGNLRSSEIEHAGSGSRICW